MSPIFWFDKLLIRRTSTNLQCSSAEFSIRETSVEPKYPKTTVYFDGSCSLCRSEIGFYRRDDQDRALCFVDVSKTSAIPPEGVSQDHAMKRFHVRACDGSVLSGAAAFMFAKMALGRASCVPAGSTHCLGTGLQAFSPGATAHLPFLRASSVALCCH